MSRRSAVASARFESFDSDDFRRARVRVIHFRV